MNRPKSVTSSRRGPNRRLAFLILAGLAAVASGCASSSKSDSSAPPPPAPATIAATDDLEQTMLIGPAAARELGYRISWQYPYAGSNIRMLSAQGDSVFVIDGSNMLTRIDRAEGTRIWSLAVGNSALDEILGITYIPEDEKVILTTGGAMFVHDAATGSQIEKQKLEKIANTAPVLDGNFLIYGSRNGQMCWHAWRLGAPWKSYQISPSMQIPPTLVENKVVAVGNDGRIMILLAKSATQVWSRSLLDRVVAPPAAGNGAVYVADLNHTLWAFDLMEERSALWRYLTESPLTQSPTLLGDRVYQHIPSEGLVCFEALPVDKPGGEVIWRCPEAAGNVLGQSGDRLFVWDQNTRRMELVDATYGAVISSTGLPRADHLMLADEQASELFAAGADGRVIRLVPRTGTTSRN